MGIGAYRRRKELEMLDVVKDLLILMISSSLISNVVLSQFLGLCPFLGVSKKVDTAVGMGGAVIFVITIASGVAAVIYKGVIEAVCCEEKRILATMWHPEREQPFTDADISRFQKLFKK